MSIAMSGPILGLPRARPVVMTIRAPPRASATAGAAPSPEADPVTSVHIPSNELMS